MATDQVRIRAPERRSNVVFVADALRDAIVKGRFGAGARIKEAPLAKQLGVSHGPIRDALRLLQAEGLIEIHPNRGAVVPEVHAADVLEVYVVRARLGDLALLKRMLDPTTPSSTEMKRALRTFEQAVARGDEGKAAEADLEFQQAIVRSAGMPRVDAEFERLTWQVRMFISALDLRYTDKLQLMFDEVEQLYASIVACDLPAARGLWREKFERWMHDMVDLLPDENVDSALWMALTSRL